MSDVQALMPEGTQHLIEKIKTEKEDVFRFSYMPTGNEENVGRIIQFLGTTSANYTHGYFYECKKNSGGGYLWQQTDVQPDVDISGKEDRFRYTTMPTASADNVGEIIQYIGETTQVAPIYTNGYFYKCVAQGTDPETYAWEFSATEDGGDSRIGEEITSIKVKMEDGNFRPYITVNPSTMIPTFATATLDDIATIADLYYNGTLSLTDVQEVWNLGDSKNITISAMDAIGVGESHTEQTVSLKLVDFNHDNLETSINGKTKAFITLGFELAETGYYHSTHKEDKWTVDDGFGGWKECARRTWCNSVCKNALPTVLRDGLKNVLRTVDDGNFQNMSIHTAGTETTIDSVFIPSIIEFLNRVVEKSETSWSAVSTTNIYPSNLGTVYGLYADTKTHNNTLMTCSSLLRLSSDDGKVYTQLATSSGGGNIAFADTAQGIMPHFCI